MKKIRTKRVGPATLNIIKVWLGGPPTVVNFFVRGALSVGPLWALMGLLARVLFGALWHPLEPRYQDSTCGVFVRVLWGSLLRVPLGPGSSQTGPLGLCKAHRCVSLRKGCVTFKPHVGSYFAWA